MVLAEWYSDGPPPLDERRYRRLRDRFAVYAAKSADSFDVPALSDWLDALLEEFLGHPLPEYGRSTPSDVVVILRGGRPDLAWVRLVSEEERVGPVLGLDDLLALRAATEDPLLSVRRVQAITQADPKSAAAVVVRLLDRGLLERRGGPDRFGLVESARRRLRLPQPDWRRVRCALDPVEASILDHVAARGRITRGHVSAEHSLGADQAKRLLAGMVARGLLQRRGEGRGAYYEAAQKKRAVARSNGRPPVSATEPPDSGREGGPSCRKKGKGRQ